MATETTEGQAADGQTSGQAPVTVSTPAQSTSTSTPQPVVADQAAKPTGFTYQDDRSRWIPPHRLVEETAKRERLNAELEQTRKQLQALAGVTPTDPGQMKTDQVREAITQLFPQLKHLANLTDEQMEQLLQAPSGAARAAEIEAREYARHGRQQLDQVYSAVADTIGADELSADQKTDLRESFVAWFQNTCKQELDASQGTASATLTRYENADPTLLQDFVKRYTNNWIEPARRRVTAQTIQRARPVPSSMGRSTVTSNQKPAEFKSLDERLDYAAKLFEERGGSFGR